MIFNYNIKAGKKEFILEGDSFVHIFKSRRTEENKILEFRNMEDDFTYFYEVKELKKKKAILVLKKKEEIKKKKIRKLHLAWCLIDPKAVKEALPYLNQLGVSEISFIHCERSQKNFNLKIEKIEKILISSSEQCGRNNLMKINIFESYKKFEEKNDNIFLLDFGGEDINKLEKKDLDKVEIVLIGPEGGISSKERDRFFNEQVISFDTGLVLKSESAAIAISSKLLL
ncbi:MAG TPA: 16S rRNA (uracil(1498)-N(3))-methyltransferase [Candidatus Pacebacteria bacterium]|nr:16S rRNA (uracil(1498)-N(3))-methyltransferase [Candidatus Paceibacterota bacterium]